VLSICDTVLKDPVCNSEEYDKIDNKQDTLVLLRCIKKIMFSTGEDNTHMGYNHVIAITNYYLIQQECHHCRSIVTNSMHTEKYVKKPVMYFLNGKYNGNTSESNDGTAFTTLTEENEQKKSDKKRKLLALGARKGTCG